MAGLILLFLPPLFWYWLRRTSLLIHGTDAEIDETPKNDLATVRTLTCLPMTQSTPGPF